MKYWLNENTKEYYEAEVSKLETDIEVIKRPESFSILNGLIHLCKWENNAWVLDRELWLNALIKPERDSKLIASDWLVIRHRDQLANSESTTITNEQYLALLTYRKALRDFPTIADYNNLVYPTMPF
jgi:hypothetical protein